MKQSWLISIWWFSKKVAFFGTWWEAPFLRCERRGLDQKWPPEVALSVRKSKILHSFSFHLIWNIQSLVSVQVTSESKQRKIPQNDPFFVASGKEDYQFLPDITAVFFLMFERLLWRLCLRSLNIIDKNCIKAKTPYVLVGKMQMDKMETKRSILEAKEVKIGVRRRSVKVRNCGVVYIFAIVFVEFQY